MRDIKLKTKHLGERLYYFNDVNSTNEKADILAANVAEGTVIIAKKQRNGIGRFGRAWISPVGGVYISVILKPKITPREASKISLITGIAIATVIRNLGLEAKIKWPNDVLIHGKKVCGILTRISTKDSKIDYAIVGIGLNVNVDISTFPKELQKSATSLNVELKKNLSVEKVIEDILYAIEANYEILKEENFTYLLNEWTRLSDTLGKKVMIKMKTETIKGAAVGINREGALILMCESGSLRNIIAGECIHLRTGDL
ncbi:BirA family transcriptional regulator [Methanophagales archaeon]|nr:BirA family transcriptional regulator [Methanophagales archaeon]